MPAALRRLQSPDGTDEIDFQRRRSHRHLKNGTEYVLRFGDLAQVDDDLQKAGGADAK